MFHQLLKIIQTGEAHNLQEIALSMNISPDMALQIIRELTNKGYLQEISSDCDVHQNGCSDCVASKNCHLLIRQWLLTKKGEIAVSGMANTNR